MSSFNIIVDVASGTKTTHRSLDLSKEEPLKECTSVHDNARSQLAFFTNYTFSPSHSTFFFAPPKNSTLQCQHRWSMKAPLNKVGLSTDFMTKVSMIQHFKQKTHYMMQRNALCTLHIWKSSIQITSR